MRPADELSDDPGPDDLAPGWGESQYTVDGYLRHWSMFTSGITRQRHGWRRRIGWVAAVVLLVSLLVPLLFAVLSI